MMRRTKEPSAAMKFGYFTLSDNRYPNNPRSPEQFLVEIRDQAVLAEKIGLNSAWIGEHHFNRRGCVSVPAVVLASVGAATTRLRLGPAVVVLPIPHPIHVAEEWATLDQLSGGRVDFAAGRGYDSHEFTPFNADFHSSAEQFSEGIALLMRCWTETRPFNFNGRFYNFEDVEVFPKPAQEDFRPYMGSFSRFSMELAAKGGWNRLSRDLREGGKTGAESQVQLLHPHRRGCGGAPAGTAADGRLHYHGGLAQDDESRGQGRAGGSSGALQGE